MSTLSGFADASDAEPLADPYATRGFQGWCHERLDLEGFLSHLAEDFVMAKEDRIMPLDVFSKHLAESFSAYDHQEIEWQVERVTVLSPTAVVVTSSVDWIAFDPQGEVSWDGRVAWTALFEQRAGAGKITHGHLSWASEQS